MSNSDVVHASLYAFHAQDLRKAGELLADNFVFTSPQDDHIGKQDYLTRCFPTADRFTWQEVLELVEVGPENVFLLYEYELQTGQRYRNTEFITVRDGRIVQTQVFFGGAVPDSSRLATSGSSINARQER